MGRYHGQGVGIKENAQFPTSPGREPLYDIERTKMWIMFLGALINKVPVDKMPEGQMGYSSRDLGPLAAAIVVSGVQVKDLQRAYQEGILLERRAFAGSSQAIIPSLPGGKTQTTKQKVAVEG